MAKEAKRENENANRIDATTKTEEESARKELKTSISSRNIIERSKNKIIETTKEGWKAKANASKDYLNKRKEQITPTWSGTKKRLGAPVRGAGKILAASGGIVRRGGVTAKKATIEHGKAIVTEGVSVNLFFFFAILTHIIDGLYQYNLIVIRTIAYISLGLLGWFMAFRNPGSGFNSKESVSGLIKSIMLAVVAWGLPLALLNLGPQLTISSELLNILVSVWPFYLIWFVFLEPTTPLLHNIQKIITFFWVIIGIMALYSAVEAGQLNDIPALRNTEKTDIIGAWGNVWQMFKNAIGDMMAALTNIPKLIKEGIEYQLEYATGGEYHSGIEEQTEEKLGVFLKDIKPSNPKIKENESIELWGNLEVRNKDEGPLLINIKCNSSNITGTHSINQFSVEGDDDIDIDCVFKNGFKKGSHKINMIATYNFETSAYIKIHLMDEERKKTMKKAGLDVFDEFGITEKNPVSRYTNGPIKIGISTSSQPVGVDQESTIKPKIGFTIENSWQGKIKNITTLKITIPKGLELDNEFCDYEFKQIKSEENTITYEIIEKIDEIKTYRSFNCRTKITDTTSLLGNAPLSTKEISISAEYIFESEENIRLSIT